MTASSEQWAFGLFSVFDDNDIWYYCKLWYGHVTTLLNISCDGRRRTSRTEIFWTKTPCLKLWNKKLGSATLVFGQQADPKTNCQITTTAGSRTTADLFSHRGNLRAVSECLRLAFWDFLAVFWWILGLTHPGVSVLAGVCFAELFILARSSMRTCSATTWTCEKLSWTLGVPVSPVLHSKGRLIFEGTNLGKWTSWFKNQNPSPGKKDDLLHRRSTTPTPM